MLTKLSVEHIRALHVMVRMPWWSVISKLMERELNATYERMQTEHDVVTLHQLQGRARLLCEVRTTLATTQETLNKFEKTR